MMERILHVVVAILATGIAAPGTAQSTDSDRLVPRLMLYSLASDKPRLRAIGNLPATITDAPILIFHKDGSITASSMTVDKVTSEAGVEKPDAQEDKSSPESP